VRLLSDWQAILRRAWSIRLMLLAGLLSGAEVILPLFVEAIPRNLFAVLSMLTVMGAMVARLLAQKGLSE
jgi:hypothetical protein